jgi:hypothetical protein
MAAGDPKDLWLIPDMGHAESACGQQLVDRIGRWIGQATLTAATSPAATSPAASSPTVSSPASTSPEEPAAQTPNAAA